MENWHDPVGTGVHADTITNLTVHNDTWAESVSQDIGKYPSMTQWGNVGTIRWLPYLRPLAPQPIALARESDIGGRHAFNNSVEDTRPLQPTSPYSPYPPLR